jgi:uncharacterized protein YkwD
MIKQGFLLRKSFIFLFVSFFLLTLSSFTKSEGSLANDVLDYTNQFRKSNGRSSLIMKEDLNAIARKHSENMAKGRTAFGHTGFDQRHLQAKRIYKSCTMAENVAYGLSTGKAVVKMWQNSSGHRKNMLGNYKYIGIGTAKDSRDRIYYTQIFVR